MKASKKIDKRLARRTADYLATMEDKRAESKVQQRINSGGYTRPGSRKKNG